MRVMSFLLLAAGLTLAAPTLAQESGLGEVNIGNAFSPPSPPSVPHGAVYMDISVKGDTPAVLVGASSPASETIELHDMLMDDGVMSMRRVEQFEIPGDSSISLRPGGGHHLMLMNLVAPYNEGDSFPLTLKFAERADVQVQVSVQREENINALEEAQPGDQ